MLRGVCKEYYCTVTFFSFQGTFSTATMIDHEALVSAMMSYSEQQFSRALRKEPERRGLQVNNVIKSMRAGGKNREKCAQF